MSQMQFAPNNGTAYRTPLWVKAFGIVALILAIMVGMMLLSGGQHGPGIHMPSNAGENMPAMTSMPQHGAQHP